MAIVDKPTDYFNTILWTGNDTDNRTISGVGFAPNWSWIKARNNADQNYLVDTLRGSTKVVFSDSSSAEQTRVSAVKSFASDGYVLGQEAQVNRNGGTFVSWNWKAGTAISNNAGSPVGTSLASSGSVNTTAGFSAVIYASNGNNYTVPHGLGVAPNLVIVKNRSIDKFWAVYHSSLGNTKAIFLDTTAAADTDATYWQNTTPTSTVFSVGTNSGNNSGNAMVAYSFAEKQSYSKIGTYIGNGNVNGPFIYTGFKPSFIIGKRTDSSGGWWLLDSKRPGFNITDEYLTPNNSDAERNDNSFSYDFLSNGFKCRYNNSNYNGSGGTYIYMAFAENPFVTSTDNDSIPTTAR